MNAHAHPGGSARAALPSEPTVVLAYSGGLDTSIIVPWLRATYGARVVCVRVDVGQGDDPAQVRRKALGSGAVACEVVDAREAFVSEYVWPTLRAGAVYARKYLLGTAMARPVTARSQVEVARAVGADALAHGCTGKGNDQVRFELTYAAFAPDLPVIAPWREWEIRSREDAIEYAAALGIPVEATAAKIYSRDRNLWHCSHEGGPLEDPDFEPPDDLFLLTTAPEAAPDRPAVLTIGFEGGYPVSVDGERLAPVDLLAALNEIGGAHGVGRADLIEDRLVGMKSRGVYETPGGTILTAALRELETLVLDRRSLALKDGLAARYADLVYEGRWWSAERKAMDALVDSLLAPVTGEVRLKLYKGSVTISGRKSPNALYDAGLATFGAGAAYDHAHAAGFIRLFGLPTRVEALRDRTAGAAGAAGEAAEPSAAPQEIAAAGTALGNGDCEIAHLERAFYGLFSSEGASSGRNGQAGANGREGAAAGRRTLRKGSSA